MDVSVEFDTSWAKLVGIPISHDTDGLTTGVEILEDGEGTCLLSWWYLFSEDWDGSPAKVAIGTFRDDGSFWPMLSQPNVTILGTRPLNAVVSLDGTPGGGDPGATTGVAWVLLLMATPQLPPNFLEPGTS